MTEQITPEIAALMAQGKGLKALASFREHSTQPGVFVGMIDGKACVIHPCTHEDSRQGLALFHNEIAQALGEAAAVRKAEMPE